MKIRLQINNYELVEIESDRIQIEFDSNKFTLYKNLDNSLSIQKDTFQSEGLKIYPIVSNLIKLA